MNQSPHLDLDTKTIYKMAFIYNSLEQGWSVKKRDGNYIFQKAHNGKKEIFQDDYLEKFILENSSMETLR
jgi:hypothetical protein